jgi:hypothetical protein
VVRDGRLKEVAGAVHLVEIEVRPALAGALAREVGVEIAVRALGSFDHGDGLVDHRFQVRLGIRTGGHSPRCGLQPLVDVGVVEIATLELAVQLAGRPQEIIDPPGPPEEAIL